MPEAAGSISIPVITVTGEAMKLEPGATYVIEMSHHLPVTVLEDLRKWGDEHGLKFVVLGPEAKIKREPEPCNLCNAHEGLPFCANCGRKLK